MGTSVIFGLTQKVHDTERFGQTLTLREDVTLRRRESCPVSERLRNFLDGEACQGLLSQGALAVIDVRCHAKAIARGVDSGPLPIDDHGTKS